MQLLALSFAIFVPSLLFSCTNSLPGESAENFDTRVPQDTTVQDTTSGFTGTVGGWNDTIQIGAKGK
ncbi:MAG: hypothetical protein E7099_00450 [Mediterranea massiliensis]|nr:hypothetical protein [Mediterranea massiliensis]